MDDIEINTSELQRYSDMEDVLDAHDNAAAITAELPKKKRIRTTTTSLACETCRLKHKKCDGVQPVCSRCAKVEEACVYVTKRRKRGPPKQSETLGSVASAPKKPKLVVSKSKPTTLKLTTKATQPKLSSSGLHAENELVNSSLFSTYVNLYDEHVASLIFHGAVSVPEREYKNFMSLKDNRKRLFMTGILSAGARLTGHLKSAHEYYMNGRKLLGELYDDTSALVAATHVLLSLHYTSLGDIDKASYATSLAQRIIELLLRTRPHETHKDGVNYGSLYLHTLLLGMDVTPTQTPQSQMLLHMLKLSEELDLGSTRAQFKTFFKMIYFTNEALVAPMDQVPQYLQEFNALAAELPAMLNMKRPSVYHRLCMLTESSLAMINLRAGDAKEATRAADTLMNFGQFLGTNYYDIFMASSLFVAAQVYIRLNCNEKYHQTLQLLTVMAEAFPMARRTCTRLAQIKELVDMYKDQPDAISLIPIQPGWSWEFVEAPSGLVALSEDQSSTHTIQAPYHLSGLTMTFGTSSPPTGRSARQFLGILPNDTNVDLNLDRTSYYIPLEHSSGGLSSVSSPSLSSSAGYLGLSSASPTSSIDSIGTPSHHSFVPSRHASPSASESPVDDLDNPLGDSVHQHPQHPQHPQHVDATHVVPDEYPTLGFSAIQDFSFGYMNP